MTASACLRLQKKRKKNCIKKTMPQAAIMPSYVRAALSYKGQATGIILSCPFLACTLQASSFQRKACHIIVILPSYSCDVQSVFTSF